MKRNALASLLGVDHPILLAPMAGVAGGELAGQVSDSGAFGIVGGGYGDSDFLNQQLSLLGTNKPFGVGFITWKLKEKPELLEVALARKPRAILLSFGDPEPFVETIKANGALFIAQCQSVSDAEKAAFLGADIVIAQGTEAGGHGSHQATMSLLPAVVDALPGALVVGAGGIGDGRGLAACLMLGAAGVMIGSRFYASKESLAPHVAKMKAVQAGGDDTTRSSVFDVLREYNWPKPYNLRTLKNPISEQYEQNMPSLIENKALEIARFNTAVEDNDFETAPVIVGEAVGLINDLPSAKEIVRRMMTESAQAIESNYRRLKS
jgi:nitronate monooxygenase